MSGIIISYNIHSDINQVIGLTNEDPVSTEYRPLKQIIEWLDRTFKRSYKTTYRFKSPDGSITFTKLFAAYFNFLRPLSALERSVPVAIPELGKLPNMPTRWIKLLQLAENYLVGLQLLYLFCRA